MIKGAQTILVKSSIHETILGTVTISRRLYNHIIKSSLSEYEGLQQHQKDQQIKHEFFFSNQLTNTTYRIQAEKKFLQDIYTKFH